MLYYRGVGAVALAAALCCVADYAGRRAVDRTGPEIALEVVPYVERAYRAAVSYDLLLMKEGLDEKLELARMATNPLLGVAFFCRARVTNDSPVPLVLCQSNSIIRHESGRQLLYRDVSELTSSVREVVTVPAGGQAVVGVDLFGFCAGKDVLLPGRYEIRIVFRSADTEAEYTSPPISITLTAEQILEFRREY